MTIQGGRVVVSVEGRDVGLTELIQKVQSRMNTGITTARQYSKVIDDIKPDEAKILGFAQAQARAAVAAGDLTGATNILAGAIGRVSPNTTQAQSAIAQLQTTLNKQQETVQKSETSFTAFTNTLFRLAGTVAIVQRVGAAIGDLIAKGNELERTQATFRALSGSPELYEKNLAIARDQQTKFGGSLNDTLDGMSGFVNMSRRYGIELDKITNLARAMAIIDPAQGFKGSAVALKEFFSGDISSLVRRFELPRAELNDIKGIKDYTEKFERLTEVLAGQGISVDLLNAQMDTTAVQFDKLGGAADDFKATLGQGFAAALAPAASGLANVLNSLTESFRQAGSGIQALTGSTPQFQAFTAQALVSAKSVGEFNAKIAEMNEKMPVGAKNFQELTPAQFEYAQSLLNIKVSADEAIARINAMQPAMDRINQTMQLSGVAMRVGADEMQKWDVAVMKAATSSSDGAAYAQQLAFAIARGSITFDQGVAYLYNFIGAIEDAANKQRDLESATGENIKVTSLFTSELQSAALEATNASIQSDALKLSQEQLYNAAMAAASGLTGTAAQAASLQAQFSITTAEAYNLINALRQLNFAKEVGEMGIGQVSSGQQNQMFNRGAAVEAAGYRRELEKISQIERSGEYARASNAQKVKMAQQDLDRLKKGTVAYAEARQKLLNAQKQLDAENNKGKGKGKGAKSPKLSDQEKLNNSLLAQQDKFNNKFEDAEMKHAQNIEKIYAEHYKELAEQQAENETSKRRSRYDFYSGLEDMEGVDTGALAAQYEQSFAEAQAIAQQGNAKLADDYLKMRQQQIEELAQLEKQKADVIADDDLSDKQRQAQLEYLEGRRKLLEDAQKEERDQLMKSGDELNNDLNERLTAEEEAYAASTDKISTQAERAADAKIKQAERSKKAVTAENKELAAQLDYVEKITDATNPTSTAAKRPNADTPTEVATPIPTGQQIISVFDTNVLNGITDQTVRLESKLQQVIDAVTVNSQDIANRIDMLRSALNNSSSNLVRA